MLSQVRIQRYKSLYDVTVDLEPLTVFIGPNGSGKSNICESLLVASLLINHLMNSAKSLQNNRTSTQIIPTPEQAFDLVSLDLDTFKKAVSSLFESNKIVNKFWRGQTDMMQFDFCQKNSNNKLFNQLLMPSVFEISILTRLMSFLERVTIYDFAPSKISAPVTPDTEGVMETDGEGLVNILTDIILMDRERFGELESRFTQLVPNISRISIERIQGNQFTFNLIDKYSGYKIPATEVSDGTLRILAFLTALYQKDTPNILCFEEPENGIHPWLLHKLVELLNLVSTEGIAGQPVQVLVTTHSPDFLNYLKPEQIRAVELDGDGKTQVHTLPTDSAGFQASMKAYDGELGELWFSNIFGGNPK